MGGIRALLATALLLMALPSWAHASEEGSPRAFEPWVRSGIGMVKDIAIADVDNDADAEILVGGRGIALADSANRANARFRWSNKWMQPDGSHGQGDWDLVSEMRVADVTGDEIEDVIVGADQAPYVLDGKTGRATWTFSDYAYASPTEPHFQASDGAWRLDVADLNGDGTKDLVFADLWDDGVTAVDVKNNTRLWYLPRQGAVMDLKTGDVNGDGAVDVVVVGAPSDTGLEVSAISGATGVALWSQPFLGLPDPTIQDLDLKGDPVAIEIGQVSPGPLPEVIVGGASAEIEIMNGASGLPISFWKTPLPAMDLALAEIDNDPESEILVGARDLSREARLGSVLAYDGIGALLWQQAATAPVHDIELIQADADGTQEILVGGGYLTPDGVSETDGFVEVMQIDLVAPQRVAWTQLLPEHVPTVEFGNAHGSDLIIAGQGVEGGIAAYTPDGTPAWQLRTGGRIEMVAVADLAGNDIPEILEAADDSTVAAHDANGNTLWEARVPGIGGPDVIEVTAADLTGTARDEVLVGTFEFNRDEPAGGQLHVYDASGDRLWSKPQPGAINALIAQDADGDGIKDVFTATSAGGSAARYTATGDTVWEVPVEGGIHVEAALANVNADGTQDLVIVTKRLFGDGGLYALDGKDGSLLWERPSFGMNWIDVEAGRVAIGDLAGRVYEIDPVTGEELWVVETGGSSWDGGWTLDVDGDGTEDIISTSEVGATHAISSTTRSVIWAADTPKSEIEPGSPPVSARGFQVATVAGPDGPRIVVGTFAGRGPSAVQTLDLLTGAELDLELVHSYVMDIVGADLSGDGAEEIVAAAGWNLHALSVD